MQPRRARRPRALRPFAPAGGAAALRPAAPRPAPRRSPAKLVGVVVGVMALLGATVFAVTALDQPDGASSPEAAVHQLFERWPTATRSA